MKKSLLALILLTLTACTNTPVTAPDTEAEVQPLHFGTPEPDVALALAEHASGVYVAGFTYGDLHDRQRGNGDAFVRKYDRSGRVLWGRQFGTRSFDVAGGVATDASGNVYVAGYTFGSLAGSVGGDDGFVRKYSPQGRVLWTRQFGTRNGDYALKVSVYGSSVYVVGVLANYETGDSNPFVQKLGTDGTLRWRRVFGTPYPDGAFGVATDRRGNVYVVGNIFSLSGTPEQDMFVRKYTPAGTPVWTRRPDYSGFESASGVAVDGESVYLAGFSQEGPENIDARVVKFSTRGRQLWSKPFDLGGNDYVYDLSASSQGVFFAGQTLSNEANPGGSGDGYVVGLTPEGQKLWTTRLSSPEYDETRAVLATSTGVYAAGYTEGRLGERNRGGSDAYLTRLRSSDGRRVWTHQ